MIWEWKFATLFGFQLGLATARALAVEPCLAASAMVLVYCRFWHSGSAKLQQIFFSNGNKFFQDRRALARFFVRAC